MMGHKAKMISGSEYDAFTKYRHLLPWQSGERHKIKETFSRRQRRREKQSARESANAAIGMPY